MYRFKISLRTLTVFLLIYLFSTASIAASNKGIIVGPSFSFEGKLTGVDFTKLNGSFPKDESGRVGDCYFPCLWGSIGVNQSNINNKNYTLPYLEAGVNLLILNFGIGKSIIFDSELDQNNYHFFYGLGIPVYKILTYPIFIQIYNRDKYQLRKNSNSAVHESGLLIKTLF